MLVAAKYLPILVTGDRGDLRNGKSRLEEPARTLVPKVMEVEVP
jgi:hypothetical protein